MNRLRERVYYGVIGGSGVYEIEGITDVVQVRPPTPFGQPSDAITVGTVSGVRCAFLPRHGKGHKILPSELNNRANLYALKSLGVGQVISVSACGSLKEQIHPRDFVVPDQLFDRTRGRPSTFFGNGIVGHVSMAHPYCAHLSAIVFGTAQEIGLSVHEGGTYVCIEGPQFSTKAESIVYRSLGFSIIGMTNLPEAKLAREAEICYATVGLVTDYDVWKEDEEVSVSEVMGSIAANVYNVKRLIAALLPRLTLERTCECAQALKYAVMTAPEAIPAKTRKDLDLLVGKYLKASISRHSEERKRRRI
jgi:5'-methylthioadenosine phosphorylase